MQQSHMLNAHKSVILEKELNERNK